MNPRPCMASGCLFPGELIVTLSPTIFAAACFDHAGDALQSLLDDFELENDTITVQVAS